MISLLLPNCKISLVTCLHCVVLFTANEQMSKHDWTIYDCYRCSNFFPVECLEMVQLTNRAEVLYTVCTTYRINSVLGFSRIVHEYKLLRIKCISIWTWSISAGIRCQNWNERSSRFLLHNTIKMMDYWYVDAIWLQWIRFYIFAASNSIRVDGKLFDQIIGIYMKRYIWRE